MSLFSPRPIRRVSWAVAPTALLLALSAATTQAQVAKPGATAAKSRSLARYVPNEGLVVLLDHEGVDSQPSAWKGTAAYKMLNETALGAMLEDIAVQTVDRGLQAVPNAPINGKDAVALVSHLASKGFAFGFCGSFGPPRPQPRAGVFVIRDAAKNEVFTRVVKRLEAFAKQVEEPGGRKVWVGDGPPLRWWFEKDDLVFSFAPPGAPDPVVATLDGQSPSAVTNPGVIDLAKAEPGVKPVGLLLVDLAGLPPLPPDAVRLGLDGVKRIESCWGIREKAVVISLGVHAPRPRRGVLTLFDQPPLGAGTRFADPKQADHTLVSVDPLKVRDVLVSLLKQSDPNGAEELDRVAQELQRRTGVDLSREVLSKIGPRMGVLVPNTGGFGNVIAMWFNPPNIGIVAELKDPKGFAAALDRLVEAANVALKKAGALVPPPPGQEPRPGTAYAEFRRLKAPEQGFVLAVPPSVLPTPAGLRPTILIDAKRGRIALAGSPAAARRVLPALILGDPKSKSKAADDRDALIVAQSDPSGGLPEFLVNLPSLVQMVGIAAAQPPGPGATPRRRPRSATPFRLEFDPDAVPDVEAIRAHLFPSRFLLTANETSIRLTSSTAFPLPLPQLNAGMESPILIAMLLPAVQSAREAARRAQCVNNLKQMGLALFNHEATNGRFPPPAVLSKQGRPLLSWRVAILPYLDQQALYNEFHLDEPWDSEHNKTLIDKMPTVFRCPSEPNPEPGTTAYRVFTGKGAAFDQPEGLQLPAVTDGTSNTIGIVEAKESVVWTKPDDLPFTGDGADALELLGSDHAGGFNALFLDGSVRYIKRTLAANVLKALLTYSGGEIVGADSY